MNRWRHANPERKKEADRRWREANPERNRERHRGWCAANPDRVRELGMRWREANPERAREQTRQWRRANPDRAREKMRLDDHARRARKLNATDPLQPVTAAIKDRRFLLFGNVCCFCGAGGKLTLEHVVALAKGGLHIPSNLAPACHRCNCSKNDTPVETWYPRQPFFSAERWEFLQANTGNRWSVAEQLSLLAPTPPAAP
jgi:hypothetical protein